MRFFEFEAREVVKRADIPVTDYGFTTDAAEARQIAERIGGPTVIKSQVLTGGRHGVFRERHPHLSHRVWRFPGGSA